MCMSDAFSAFSVTLQNQATVNQLKHAAVAL